MISLFKLDARFDGFDIFRYGVTFATSNEIEFIRVRNWCWVQFGPSCELKFYRKYRTQCNDSNNKWAWSTDKDRRRIYLLSDKEASWFSLTWVEHT
jgi:hypothetical protein